MTDYDRDPEPVRETHRTTVIDTGDRGRGGGGVIAIVLLLLVVLAIAFFLFRGSFNRAANDVGVNVNVPAVKAPDINVKVPDKIDLKVPNVNVKTEKTTTTNTSR